MRRGLGGRRPPGDCVAAPPRQSRPGSRPLRNPMPSEPGDLSAVEPGPFRGAGRTSGVDIDDAYVERTLLERGSLQDLHDPHHGHDPARDGPAAGPGSDSEMPHQRRSPARPLRCARLHRAPHRHEQVHGSAADNARARTARSWATVRLICHGLELLGPRLAAASTRRARVSAARKASAGRVRVPPHSVSRFPGSAAVGGADGTRTRDRSIMRWPVPNAYSLYQLLRVRPHERWPLRRHC
jgi:hypothetical protein